MSGEVEVVVERLLSFRETYINWARAREAKPSRADELRARINQDAMWVRSQVLKAGCLVTVTIAPPPAIGGVVMRNADPFDMLFDAPYGQSVGPTVLDMIDRTVGVLRSGERDDAVREEGMAWESLLHASVRTSALAQFENGHYRDSVLNSIVAVFDLIRTRTGLPADGDALATRVFSVERPILVIADTNTDSGRSEQRGFMQLVQGAYAAIRNPKAHTLRHEPTREVAAQYLIFASLLARRVEEATLAGG